MQFKWMNDCEIVYEATSLINTDTPLRSVFFSRTSLVSFRFLIKRIYPIKKHADPPPPSHGLRMILPSGLVVKLVFFGERDPGSIPG